jgi:HlyD family secretion protein
MRRSHRVLAVVAVLAAGVAAYRLWPAEPRAPIAGVVRATEIKIAPEISGRLAAVRVRSGDAVHRGDVLAELANPELQAALFEARAAAGEARAARDRVYAGVRQEQVAILAREIEKAEANVLLAEQHGARIVALAARDNASKQELDQATAEVGTARALLAAARQRHAEAQAGPTQEERAAADARVAEAEAAALVIEQRLRKSVLAAPSDGVVRVIVAEPGEAVRPGQPVLTVEAGEERWFAFNIREDRLGGVSVGAPIELGAAPDKVVRARITEIRGLGEFATWRAARAVGDHDLNTFRVRADPTGPVDLDPGATVWLAAPAGSASP